MAEDAQSTNSADEKVVDNERSLRTNHLPSPSYGMKTSTTARTVVEQRCQELENKLQMEKQTQYFLKKEIERLASFADRDPNSLVVSPNIIEGIEILKQQLRVYADDFAEEQCCRENIQADRERLKEKLKKCEDKIALLEQQVRIFQHCFNRERNKREEIQQQICDQGLASVVQDSHDLHSNVMAKFEELKQQVHMLIQGATNGRTDQEHVQAIGELKQKLKACEELIAVLMELLLGPEIIRSAVP